MTHDLLNVLVLVVSLGVIAQWIAWRLRLPAIVLFLIAGVIVGPVFGWVRPSVDLGDVYRPVVSLCVAVILFEGGLTLRLHEFKEAASGVKRLVSIGAIFAFGLGSLAAKGIGDLDWPVALVFGAIMVVTGPTVIIPLLRQARLNRRTASYLKWEGIINDPIGALAAVLIFQFFVYSGGGDPLDSVLISLGIGSVAAILIGGGAALLIGWAFRNAYVPEYLKAPVMLAGVLVVFAASNTVQHEAGLLAVTLMGMVLGNLELPNFEEMRRFKEYITILLVSSVFVLLTADLDPVTISHLDWHAIALVASMLIIVRPLAILLATVGADMKWNERLLLSWIAPRGIVAAAVAGLFGPEMLDAGYEDAELLLPLVFAMVLSTVTLHGFTISWLAKRLDLATPDDGVLIVGASPWTTELAQSLSKELNLSVLLVDSSWHRLREARLAGVNVIYGEILSDELQLSLQLNGVNVVLAATSNDAYNALVCRNFAGRLEHDRVFQLPMYAPDEGNRQKSKAVARPFTGIPAFADNAQYEELWRRHFQNWKFYKTKITEAYTYEDFLSDLPDESICIGVVREGTRLTFHAPHAPIKPKPGETVVYYAPKKPGAAESEARNRAEERKQSADEVLSADPADDALTS
ncbi:MAG: sodium:proton antiporter [Abyssibacter sp.]|uniref:cation:proton antiporter n=1 Tax=Abyssibacter sp. TaxID=2320200 RepID=UPI002EC9F5A8|nr:sodium:proton antiporter [Pseudomonadota bacterium]